MFCELKTVISLNVRKGNATYPLLPVELYEDQLACFFREPQGLIYSTFICFKAHVIQSRDYQMQFQ